MESNGDHPEQNFSPLSVQEVDVDFLPIVYEIIRSVEREFHDNAAKNRESQDCSQKVLELQKKFDAARAQIKRLPGIDFNKQDQLKQFEILRTQLRLKRELLQKYRNNMCSFETSFKYLASNEKLVQRIAESYPVRRAAQLAVSVFYRSKAKLHDVDPHKLDRLVAFYKRFAQNVKEGIEDAKKQVKK